MLQSIFLNWIGYFVTGAIHIVLTPILIGELGDFNYGIWVLALSVLSYFFLLDLGMPMALLRFVAKAGGERDQKALNEIFSASVGIATCIALSMVALTIVLGWLLPSFFGSSDAFVATFRQVIFLLGAGFALEFLGRMLGNYLCGLHRFDLYNGAKIASGMFRAALLLVALDWGYGLVGMATASLAAALMALLAYWALVRLAGPLLRIQGSRVSPVRVRELMGFGFFSFLNTIGNYARFHLNSVVIARVLSVGLITPFSIAAQMVEYFRSIIIGAMAPLIASFSRTAGEKPGQELQEFFIRATRFTSLLSMFLGSLLLLDGKMFIRLWVGEAFLPSYGLLVILTVAYTIMLAQVPSNCLLYALSRHRAMAVWTLAEGIANLAMSVYLARHYGLLGVVQGTAIPMAVTAVLVQPWYVLRLIRLPARTYIREALARPVASTMIFLLLCQSVADEPSKGSLPIILLWSLVWQTLLFGALSFIVAFHPEDRQMILSRCRRLAVSLGWARVG